MSSRINMIKMGNHIADLRKKKNYTQKTLGDILNIHEKTISKWENDINEPNLAAIRELSELLGCSIEYLISD